MNFPLLGWLYDQMITGKVDLLFRNIMIVNDRLETWVDLDMINGLMDLIIDE